MALGANIETDRASGGASGVVDVVRRALPATPGITAGQPIRDPNPTVGQALWGFGGHVGLAEQALLTVPRAASRWLGVELMISSAGWRLAPVDGETSAERAARDRIDSAIRGRLTTDRHRPSAAGLAEVMRQAASAWWYGHACAYLTAYDTGALEAYQVHQSSIQQIRTSRDGALEAIWQSAPGGSVTLSADRVGWMAYRAEGGNWRGAGLSRPLVFLIELYQQAALAYGRSAYMQAGLVVAQEPETLGRTAGAIDEVDSALAAFESGGLRTFRAPHGWEFDVRFPTGSGAQPPEVIDRMLSAAIDDLLGSLVASLGYVSGSGSRALGEVQREEDAERARQMLDWLGREVSGWLVPWVASHVGVARGVRLPRIDWRAEEVAEVSSAGIADYETINALRYAGEVVEKIMSGLAADTARELITKAGIAQDVADRMIAAQVAIRDSRPAGAPTTPSAPTLGAPAPMHDRGCGCGGCSTVRMSDDDGGVTVAGADGVEFTFHRALTDLEADVAWADAEAERDAADAALAAAVEDIAEEHRAAVWSAIADRSDLDAVRVRYRSRYEDAIRGYLRDLAAVVRVQTEEEIGRQTTRGLGSGDGVPPGALSEWVEGERARVELSAMQAADAIAGRVQGEVTAAVAQGAVMSTWQPLQTPDGLAREAAPAANQVEVVERIDGAREAAEAEGASIATIVRTSVRDGARCQVCRARDGLEWRLPQDAETFGRAPGSIVPDPDCEGAPRCRCGLLVRLVRRAS